MFQFFHWWTPADGNLWKEVAEKAAELAQIGVTSVWLPPASKANGGVNDVGYAVYDLYDLVRTSLSACDLAILGLRG